MLRKFVISGGPSSGKTSVINELGKEFKTFNESAREVLKNKDFNKGAQYEIFKRQLQQSNEANNFNETVFFDRGIVDSLAYFKYHGFKIPIEILENSKPQNTGYEIIFILDFVPYVKDDIRKESKEEAEEIHKVIYKVYEELKYKIVKVPFMSVEERIEFIKGFL